MVVEVECSGGAPVPGADREVMQTVRKSDIDGNAGWAQFRKKTLTRALRIDGPFEVETREGTLTCPDGWLAVDSAGWPYPIAADEFERIYEQVQR